MKTVVVHGKIETTKCVFFSHLNLVFKGFFTPPVVEGCPGYWGTDNSSPLLLWLVRLIVNTQTRFSSEPALAFILFTEFHGKEKLKLKWWKWSDFLMLLIFRIWKIKRKMADFHTWCKYVDRKYRRMLNFFRFSYCVYNQIWLTLPRNDCHFGYITKLRKIIN